MLGTGEQRLDHFPSIIKQIKEEGLSSLWRNRKLSAIVLLIVANFFNNLAVFIINIVVARRFGPDVFGVFSLAMSFMVSLNLIADLGVNLTIVRFYNLYDAEEERRETLLLSLLVWKLSVVLALVLLSYPLGLLAMRVFNLDASHTALFVLAVASAGFFGTWLYYQSYLQALRRFKKLALYIVLCAILRLMCFGVLYFAFVSSLNLTLTFFSIYSLPVLIATAAGLYRVFFQLLRGRSPALSVMKANMLAILRYGKWVALSGLCHSFIYRGVQFVLAARTTKYELGIFSAGFVFTLAFAPFNTAVRTVFFPHVTAFKDNHAMKRHLIRMRRVLPYYTIFAGVGIGLLVAVQVLFLGNEYAASLPIFLITVTALAVTIFLGLGTMMVHTFMRPEIDAYVNVARLVISTIAAYLLSPSWGAMGGALSYAVPLVLGEVLMMVYVSRLVYAE
jgi:O-antigen/teichoic acid export membrane protein